MSAGIDQGETTNNDEAYVTDVDSDLFFLFEIILKWQLILLMVYLGIHLQVCVNVCMHS